MSFSKELKEKTWDIHQRVEQAELNKKLFSADLDMATYGVILAHFEAIFAPLENAIQPFDDCKTVGYRNRNDLIQQDIENVGVSDEERPDEITIPEIKTAGQALGAAYVLEGSNMGAAFIRKRLLEVLGPDAFIDGGLDFFSQTQSGKEWQAFKARMDQFFEEQPDQQDIAVKAARDTFLAFEDAFNQFEHSSTK